MFQQQPAGMKLQTPWIKDSLPTYTEPRYNTTLYPMIIELQTSNSLPLPNTGRLGLLFLGGWAEEDAVAVLRLPLSEQGEERGEKRDL